MQIIGNGVPVFYDHANAATAAQSPNTVHCQNTYLSNYFKRYLLQKAISLFKWDLPKHWDKNYFLYVLYCWGFLAVVNTDKFGVIPQACGLYGYNVFYQPTNAIITNPLLRGELKPVIGKQCTLFKLQPDYGGIFDLVSYYADLMALCAESVGINLFNTHLAYVFAAKDKTTAESFKKMYDQLSAGNPAVVIDKKLFNADGTPAWQPFTQSLRDTYITSDVLSDMRKIEMMFDTDIGIPNANTDKKERLISSEVSANNVETASKCALWLENLQESCEKANEMFGINMKVDWRFPELYNITEGGQDDGINNEPAGAV